MQLAKTFNELSKLEYLQNWTVAKYMKNNKIIPSMKNHVNDILLKFFFSNIPSFNNSTCSSNFIFYPPGTIIGSP